MLSIPESNETMEVEQMEMDEIRTDSQKMDGSETEELLITVI